ncbi:MAG: DUF4143 domain-containing protein [Eubacterium sp.]|nr:DUF4143 domain-containing protein [Eubacterium sp.]
MGNEEKKPRIRFEGFTDAWEQRKFRDTFDFMQNNALSRADLSSVGGDVMNVHYGDVLVKYGEVLDVKTDEMTYLLDDSLVNKYLVSLLQNGDIIIADAAEDETVGKCSEIAGLTDEKVLSGLHTIPCRPRGNFAEGYLGYYMNSGSYHDQLGYLYENLIAQMIAASGRELYYHTWEKEGSTHYYEIDFLISQGAKISAIEVKSSGTGKHESLKEFGKKYSKHIKESFILSQKDIGKEGAIKYIPIYLTSFLCK